MRSIALVLLPILLPSCSSIDRELRLHEEIVYSSDGVRITQSCIAQHPIRDLPVIDHYTFAVNSRAEPFLSAYSGLYYSSTPFVAVLMGGADECRRYTAVYFEGSSPENLTFSSLENWPEIAGSSVVQAFSTLTEECMTLSEEEVYDRYGFSYWRQEDGTVVGSNHFVDCENGILSNSYAVRINGIEGNPGSIIISNVYGQIFVREED